MKIRYQSPARRCEICHQSDCFDEISNHCFRCETINVAPPDQLPAQESLPLTLAQNRAVGWRQAMILAIAIFILAFYLISQPMAITEARLTTPSQVQQYSNGGEDFQIDDFNLCSSRYSAGPDQEDIEFIKILALIGLLGAGAGMARFLDARKKTTALTLAHKQRAQNL
jgi:hypothetical protein